MPGSLSLALRFAVLSTSDKVGRTLEYSRAVVSAGARTDRPKFESTESDGFIELDALVVPVSHKACQNRKDRLARGSLPR